MANSVIKATVVAKAAVRILENELGMAGRVYRDYDTDFSTSMNGYKPGDTISIPRPADFTVRTGSVANAQDVVEGKVELKIDEMMGVDFKFTSTQLTLEIGELAERVIRPAMVQLANAVDVKMHSLYKEIPNWVGTPGQIINSFEDYYKGPERLNEFGVPMGDRYGTLSPADEAAMIGQQTRLYIERAANSAYRKGALGEIGGVDTWMSQNVQTHVVGVATGTPLIMGAAQNVTYDTVKDTNTQSLITDGWTVSTAGILKKGDVFEIAGVYAVNGVSKAVLPFLKQFVVTADAASNGSGVATLTISPPIITSGANQTVSAAPADNAAITVKGTGSTGYRQNMVFHKNAFALVMPPLVKPPGAVDVGRETYKGISVRVIPYYDGTNDVSNWRLDILTGQKAIDPRLATRVSGTP